MAGQERSIKIPAECVGCNKSGMDAVKCTLLSDDENILPILPCYLKYKYEQKGVLRKSGGRFSSGWKGCPKTIHQASIPLKNRKK